jgi:hypothetical protein
MILRGSTESQERTLTIIGAVILLGAILAGLVVVHNPFKGRSGNQISVAIDTPYIGQGVTTGAALVMHGVKIGEVTTVASLPGGGVRILSDLQKAPVAGLTDALTIDFRPVNYFGVTGINIIAKPGGQALRDGMQIHTVPQGNYALQALLSRLGEVSSAAVTPQLISVIDRTARYTDALNPLIETMLIALDAVAAVQKAPTARLLANATAIAVPFPPYVDALAYAGEHFVAQLAPLTDDSYRRGVRAFIEIASFEVFGGIGRLETKYVDDLLPAIDALKTLVDPIPALLRPDEFGQTLVELRTRLEKMFAGSPEQRALQVRIVLDSLPGVASPLAAMGDGQ